MRGRAYRTSPACRTTQRPWQSARQPPPTRKVLRTLARASIPSVSSVFPARSARLPPRLRGSITRAFHFARPAKPILGLSLLSLRRYVPRQHLQIINFPRQLRLWYTIQKLPHARMLALLQFRHRVVGYDHALIQKDHAVGD